MTNKRKSGILLHPTSLPGPYGIGTFGSYAYQWVDFLEKARQRLWQVLPLGPTGYGDSPYQSFSTFAGNPYLIDLPTLVEQGIMAAELLEEMPELAAEAVDYGGVYYWKLPLLQKAAAHFDQHGQPHHQEEFAHFCQEQHGWLDDFALFMALKDAHNGMAWNQWPMPLRSRESDAIAQAVEDYSEAVGAYKFNQWLFYRQWWPLKSYANERGIQIIGDIPIFVAMDSSDAWTHPAEFYLDDEFQPTVVAGVPPDYFSETGQLWGNPLYRWERMAEDGYQWWLKRLQAALQLYDIVRVDHFRGFAGYWEVPAHEETAINGQWRSGPGAPFFETVQQTLGHDLPIIAEDLGEITPDVLALRDQFALPGMKVLQFAFAGGPDNHFLPHNYSPNFVVYTGTHDNDTTVGWFQESSTLEERTTFQRYFGIDGDPTPDDIAWAMIAGALRSVAETAIIPLQDLLLLGTEARMNLPGSSENHWAWRFMDGLLSDELAGRLADLVWLYGRVGEV